MKGEIFMSQTGTLQINLESPGCLYKKQGFCRMCNYGSGSLISKEEAVEVFDKALKVFPSPKRVLIGTYGSILDEREIEIEVLMAIFKRLNYYEIKNIYLETHTNTINARILNLIKHWLPGRNIVVELGLESSNRNVLKNIINKSLDLANLERVVKLIHAYKMSVALNIIYGLQGVQDYQSDFVKTCKYAEDIGANEIVVFPLSIRTGTYFGKLYRNGDFSLPTHSNLISTLQRLPDKTLEKLFFSWYGERKDASIIASFDYGNKSKAKTLEFYSSFMKTKDVSKKRQLISAFLDSN